MEITGRVASAIPASPATPKAPSQGAAGAASRDVPAAKPVARPERVAAENSQSEDKPALDRLETALTETYRQDNPSADVDNRRIELHIDDASGTVFGRVVDQQTGEPLVEIPSKEMRALIARTQETLGPVVNADA
jgi:uncharacterized FlaG/YvyC family protein